MGTVAKMPNFLPAPMGPRKSTPELRAALRKASVSDVRERLADHSRLSVKTWVCIGKELAATRAAAEKDGAGVFASLFSRNAEERADPARYPFSYSQAKQLIRVAQALDVPLVTSGNRPEKLPASWRTLYELSRLPADRLAKAIEAGTVHPMMTRGEASRMVELIEHPTRKRPPRKDDPIDRAITDLRKAIKQPKKRGLALIQLIHALGFTLQQLEKIDHE